MVESAGTILQRARNLRQLSLEDAARVTKIRKARLADLEADEYSNFPNLAYAKSFLIGYGKYLHVDVRPYLEGFADTSTFGLDDYQYLSEVPVGVYRIQRRPSRRRYERRQLILAGTSLAMLVMTVFCYFMWVTYQRLGDLDKLAARQEAHARAERGPSTADAAVPAKLPAATLVPVSAPAPATPKPTAAPAQDARGLEVATVTVSDGEPRAMPALPVLPVRIHASERLSSEGLRDGVPRPRQVSNSVARPLE